jgi:hypothetical protein
MPLAGSPVRPVAGLAKALVRRRRMDGDRLPLHCGVVAWVWECL